jgi:hypothetical protein
MKFHQIYHTILFKLDATYLTGILQRITRKGAYCVRFECFCELLCSIVSDFIVIKRQSGECLCEKGKMHSLRVDN